MAARQQRGGVPFKCPHCGKRAEVCAPPSPFYNEIDAERQLVFLRFRLEQFKYAIDAEFAEHILKDCVLNSLVLLRKVHESVQEFLFRQIGRAHV